MNVLIPRTIYRLINFVSQAFYGVEEHIILRYLMFYPCISEGDLNRLIKIDRKQLRKILNKLRTEKFVRQKHRVETNEQGKSERITYFYINYITFINVVRYKLDIMQKRIDSKAKESMTRSSYNCVACKKSFEDLDIEKIFDFETNSLICDYCGEDVKEDETILTNRNSRNILVKFNEELTPLFRFLAQIEKLEIPPELIDPQPCSLTLLEQNRKAKDGDPVPVGDLFIESTSNVKVFLPDDLFFCLQEKNAQAEQPVWFSNSDAFVPSLHEEDDYHSILERLKAKRMVEEEALSCLLMTRSDPVEVEGSGLFPRRLTDSETKEVLTKKAILYVNGIPMNFYDAMENTDKMTKPELAAYMEMCGFLFDDAI